MFRHYRFFVFKSVLKPKRVCNPTEIVVNLRSRKELMRFLKTFDIRLK